jgi:hypothetical protein
MSHWAIVSATAGSFLAVANVIATVRIWRTPLLERSQRLAQTVLVWLVPGVFVAVRYELAPPPEPNDDPTLSKDYTHVVPPGGPGGTGSI